MKAAVKAVENFPTPTEQARRLVQSAQLSLKVRVVSAVSVGDEHDDGHETRAVR